MNERIKLLMLQAGGVLAPAYVTDENDNSIWTDDAKVNTIDMDAEYFAKLIVRECIDLASKEQKRYASITHRNMSECAVALGNFSLLMKDHFEDEE